jgi:hypothetical protein
MRRATVAAPTAPSTPGSLSSASAPTASRTASSTTSRQAETTLLVAGAGPAASPSPRSWRSAPPSSFSDSTHDATNTPMMKRKLITPTTPPPSPALTVIYKFPLNYFGKQEPLCSVNNKVILADTVLYLS